MNHADKKIYQFGSFQLDTAEHTLSQDGEVISLTPKVFDTLLVLVENNGHLVEKDELLEKVWADTIVEESNLAKNISILRKILSHNGLDTPIIETVPKLGYRFVTPVKKINGDVSPSEEKVRKVDSPKTNRTKFLVVTPILLLAVLAVGYFLYLNSNSTPVLTDKDFILLTDFENKTGEKIFDGTLRQALTVALRQSPFLSIFSDKGMAYTLKLMKRKPDSPITREIGAEICQRRNLKAYITGTLSRIGSEYVLGLEVINGQTGELITATQKRVPANDQKNVLDALSSAATEIRGKLGESLAQIAKTDNRLADVTTSSMDAWRELSEAMKATVANDAKKVIEHSQRAVELDPEFAMAWGVLAYGHSWSGNRKRAIEMSEKAYGFRDRLSERERLFVVSTYYNFTGETLKQLAALKEMKEKYPRDIYAGAVANVYGRLGDIEKSLPIIQEQVRLEPRDWWHHRILVNDYIALGRHEEAKRAIDAAVESGHKDFKDGYHSYVIAFIENDKAELERLNNLLKKKPQAYSHRLFDIHLFRGQLKKAKKIWKDKLTPPSPPPTGELVRVHKYIRIAAVLGQCSEVRKLSTNSIDSFHKAEETLAYLGDVTARCGDLNRTRSTIKKLQENYPKSYFSKAYYIPLLRAYIEQQSGKPLETIKHLEATRRIKGYFRVHYIRGNAYLKLNENENARREFQIVLDNRGRWAFSIFYPLAQLGKARAMKSKEEYEKFFELWKDADEDLPVLIEAKKEYAELD